MPPAQTPLVIWYVPLMVLPVTFPVNERAVATPKLADACTWVPSTLPLTFPCEATEQSQPVLIVSVPLKDPFSCEKDAARGPVTPDFVSAYVPVQLPETSAAEDGVPEHAVCRVSAVKRSNEPRDVRIWAIPRSGRCDEHTDLGSGVFA